MTTVSDLLAKYERERIPDPALTPRDFGLRYRRGIVLCDDRRVPVDFSKYRTNRPQHPDGTHPSDGRIPHQDAIDELGHASTAVTRYLGSLERTNRQDPVLERLRAASFTRRGNRIGRRFRRVFTGRASPRDITLALGLLHLAGYVDVATLQDYCNRYIGVDCSGFVNGFFTARGVRDDVTTDTPQISQYGRAGRRLASIPGAPQAHMFCWVRGESKTGLRPNAPVDFAHIALIDGWETPPSAATNDPIGAKLHTTQSSASLGGIAHQVYEILRAPGTNSTSRAWRIQRQATGGYSNRPHASYPWNEVFLAPPFAH